MKILHTADWHLGKKLDHISRFDEQIEILDEIVEIAQNQNVDMVMIAGDLFDNFNPSVEAEDLFYKTIIRLSQNGKIPVIAIAGNHDSPNQIDVPNTFAQQCGIIFIGHPNAQIKPFELEDFKIIQSDHGLIEIQLKKFDFPIRILHTAFANEIRLKQYLGENKEDHLNEILAKHWSKLSQQYCDQNGVNLLMAHLYMNQRGATMLEEPEGEKPIKIGNADMIYSDAIPNQIQYTALGHLHAYRNIGTSDKPIIYSSSPLAYSFSEAGQDKYVSIVDVVPNHEPKLTKIKLNKGKSLIRKTFFEVDQAILWLQQNQNSLIELTMISDTFLSAEDRKSIYSSHSGIVHLIPKISKTEGIENQPKEINLSQDIQTLFTDYFKTKNQNQEPNQEIIDLFKEILNQ